MNAVRTEDRPPLPPSVLRVAVFAEAYGGFGDMEGQLSFDGRRLRLDYHTKDALLGLIRSDLRQLEIPLHAIDAVSAGPGWFWACPWITLELNDFALAQTLPGAQLSGWRLRARFRDRKALRRLETAIRHARAVGLHAALVQDLEHPLRTPVAESDAEPGAHSAESAATATVRRTHTE